jgi:hypothetical protein
MTMTMQMSDASVNSIGVRIHANRPTLPMFVVVCVVVARLLLWVVGESGVSQRL